MSPRTPAKAAAKQADVAKQGRGGPQVLSEQRKRFAEGIVRGLSQAEAYLQAGYHAAPKGAKERASRLIRQPAVAAYIEELRRPAVEKAKVTADMVLNALWDEATLKEEGASHMARVNALMGLAKIFGMLDGSRAPTEPVEITFRRIDKGKRADAVTVKVGSGNSGGARED